MQVTLKIKDSDGNIEKKQHEITRIGLKELQDVMKTINDIAEEVQGDKALKDILGYMFSDEKEEMTTDDLVRKVMDSFETLTVRLPHQSIKLISVMSRIDLKELEQQDVLDAFDIFDAVVEENDLEKLIKRAKKSLGILKNGFAFMEKVQKATQQRAQA